MNEDVSPYLKMVGFPASYVSLPVFVRSLLDFFWVDLLKLSLVGAFIRVFWRE